jgi:hypothetical protein
LEWKKSTLYNIEGIKVMSQIFFDKNLGNIVETLENGVYGGTKVVSGSQWDGPIIAKNLNCLCTDNTVAADVSAVDTQMTTSALDLDSIRGYFSLEVSALPSSVQDSLTATGRGHATESEFLAAVVWADGWDEDAVLNQFVDPDPEP